MAINPHRKGGADVPVTDGGTGASNASTARSNIGAGDLDTAAHAVLNHTGIPGVGGGVFQLVETKNITSPAQSTTFAGLDGNTDGLYLLQYYWVNGTGMAAQVRMDLLPNGLSTNQSGFQVNFSAGYSQSAVSSLCLSSIALATGRAFGTAWLWARAANPGPTAVGRPFRSEWSIFSTTAMSGGLRCDGLWNDTAANITSLVVMGNLANSIGAGSVYSLYKLTI